ncbi:hypothetical protein ACJRPK_00040 [Aquimarina sp. 2-A2]|uniref:Uncharacterized protein n=1 Tax=Aquimarina intermedia TaxID=350814 RepID=A0A5S5C9K1_9FLAO|nr:hypothetical protein [Aquimarina intermedia]TYP75977.1 hypothetical protein BD809_102190 [Aquimarina intermedia]
MSRNCYNELDIFFEATKNRCYLIFQQLYILRENIQKHDEIEESIIKLKSLFFEERKKFSSDSFSINDKNSINEKCDLFFESYWISRGQVSKGNVNFFEYSIENIEHLGVIENYLSKMRRTMEIAWYGFLQQYGRLIIKSSKEI